MSANKPVTFDDCSASKETAKALLVYICDLDEELWIPKSQIEEDSEVYKEGTEGTLIACHT